MTVGETSRRRRQWLKPLEHFTERSLLGLLIVLGIGAAFGILLLLVRGEWSPLYNLDHGVAADLNAWASANDPAVTVLKAVSSVGGRPIMLWLVSIAVLGLLIRRQPRLALYLIVTGAGALLLDPSLKALVGRIRPVVDIPVSSAPGNSFPSGHALGSIVAYGAILLVFLPAMRPVWRRVAIAIWALLVLAVGFTRVALGVHFVSDVIGGWLLGLAWLGVTAYAFRLWQREEGKPAPSLSSGLDPDAADDLRIAPDEKHLLPRPWWHAIPEILTGWALVFGALYGFGMLVSYYAGGSFVATWDRVVPQWLFARRTPPLDELSWWWSKFGDTHAILLVSLVVCPLMVAAWRRWRPVLFLALVMFGELTLFLASARAVDRPRPPVENMDGQMPTASFPSGHIAATFCLYVAIAVLVFPRIRAWWRWIPVALAVIMPVGVALSRMYRGMHHPSDMMGAMLLTALWIGLLYWVVRPNADVRSGEATSAGLPVGDVDGDRQPDATDDRPLVASPRPAADAEVAAEQPVRTR